MKELSERDIVGIALASLMAVTAFLLLALHDAHVLGATTGMANAGVVKAIIFGTLALIAAFTSGYLVCHVKLMSHDTLQHTEQS